MLTKKQSEAIAEALLAPARETQEVTRRHQEQHRLKLASQQRAALFGFAGLVIGCAAGCVFHGKFLPVGFAGMGIGFILGRIITCRAAVAYTEQKRN